MSAENNTVEIAPAKKVSGSIRVPGDKSISHRAVIFGGISEGQTAVTGFLNGEDCLRTVQIFKDLGVEITDSEKGEMLIQGKGLHGLTQPQHDLYAGNSGTTMRLMLGILSGLNITTAISGDESLNKRPMMRVVAPLREMGANIRGDNDGEYAPLTVQGARLRPIDYNLSIASAQVKSSILLAGLYAEGRTKVTEPMASRDHTERMLEAFGAEVTREGLSVTVTGQPKLLGRKIAVPGDISSAAFFMVAAALLKRSELTIEGLGVNPTRTGLFDVLRWMGADISMKNRHEECGEPVADVTIKASKLKGTKIGGDIIPRLIDEIPIIAVAASLADGITIIRDAEELRVKETDRIKALSTELRKIGVRVGVLPDGLIIHGQPQLQGGTVESYGDHRMAMALSIAGLLAEDKMVVNNVECINTSFPNFFELLDKVVAR